MNIRTMKQLALVILLAWMTACVWPDKPTPSAAKNDIDAMTFARGASGLCFGVIHFQTSHGYEGITIALVPRELCDQK